MRTPMTISRRASALIAMMLLTACGSEPVAPEPQQQLPAIARWSGTYTGQSRYGAANGTWGNGGSYRLLISAIGEVTVGGVLLQNHEYDDNTATLRWTRAGGNATNGEVSFRASLTSDFYFRDMPNATAGRNFTGYIQRAGEGKLDYRGVPM